MENFFHWWEDSLAIRLAVGGGVFALLLAWDLRRHGVRSRRLREYGFLLFATAAAMAYGVLNDQVTVTISWEYFHFGKGLGGEAEQGDLAALRWGAVGVGLKATWAAGLLMGAALLIANNPRKKPGAAPPQPFARLVRMVGWILLSAAGCGAALGVVGWLGGLTWATADFRELVADDLWRPPHFMAVWGIHLGGYVGGLLATGAGVWHILRRRRVAGNAESRSANSESMTKHE